jgi:hypothetical protein
VFKPLENRKGFGLRLRLFSSTGATRIGKAKIEPFYPLGFEGLNKFFMRSQRYSILRGLNCLSEENIVQVGRITHFFSKISVAVVELTAPLSMGERILVKGPSTDFEQVVESMQIEHKNIPRAEAGQSIGLKTAEHAREKDIVYKKL